MAFYRLPGNGEHDPGCGCEQGGIALRGISSTQQSRHLRHKGTYIFHSYFCKHLVNPFVSVNIRSFEDLLDPPRRLGLNQYCGGVSRFYLHQYLVDVLISRIDL